MNGSSWQRPLPLYRAASLRQRLNQTCCSLFSWELSFSFKNPFFYTTLSLIWWKFSYKFHARKKFFLKVMFVYVLFYFTVITLILRLKTSFFTSINIKNHLTEQKRTLQVWGFCDVIKAWYDAFWKEMWKHLKEMCQDNKVNLISWFGVPSR